MLHSILRRVIQHSFMIFPYILNDIDCLLLYIASFLQPNEKYPTLFPSGSLFDQWVFWEKSVKTYWQVVYIWLYICPICIISFSLEFFRFPYALPCLCISFFSVVGVLVLFWLPVSCTNCIECNIFSLWILCERKKEKTSLFVSTRQLLHIFHISLQLDIANA